MRHSFPRQQCWAAGAWGLSGALASDVRDNFPEGAYDRGTVASLAPEFVLAAREPAEEALLEGLIVGVQVLLEAVRRLLVTLAGLLPAEAAATHGASTCGNTQSHWGSHCPLQSWVLRRGKGWCDRGIYRGQGGRTRRREAEVLLLCP